ncbi:hypothetical protein BC938DRAFT_474664 [Jimgerdemannia flammicorona]|uniref:Major facilitator superfamily domain-containing protein n=1 Tax=Jimgerdemannia flammicorona TaxID=994334 RepID=A0A433Q1U7_9FUNG|nr:hypothetical protein BC938DRAFT_474664 [Jimgerdemannia flammicorona]
MVLYTTLAIIAMNNIYLFFIPESIIPASPPTSCPISGTSPRYLRKTRPSRLMQVFGALPTLATGPSIRNRARYTLPTLALIHFLVHFVNNGAGGIVLLYGTFKFGWGTWDDALWLSFAAGATLVSLVIVSPAVAAMRKCGGHRLRKQVGTGVKLDVKAADTTVEHSGNANGQLGDGLIRDEWFTYDYRVDLWLVGTVVLLASGGWMICAFAVTEWMYYTSTNIFSALYTPSVYAIFVSLAPSAQVDAILNAISVVEATAMLFGPLFFSSLYAKTVKSEPTVVFLTCGGIMLLSKSLIVLTRASESQRSDELSIVHAKDHDFGSGSQSEIWVVDFDSNGAEFQLLTI